MPCFYVLSVLKEVKKFIRLRQDAVSVRYELRMKKELSIEHVYNTEHLTALDP